MISAAVSRADLHCHSTASQVSKLGVQRALGLPECATAPEDVYALAKRRGMDFVTITDHDTITGAQMIADRPDVFVSEELTAHFAGEPTAAVHILCYGITADDHQWLQAHASDVDRCAQYLHGAGITCALAHPFYAVAAPLAPRHRRRLAELFSVWETRNGARAAELNLPAAVYSETHGGTGIAGSDDHAGVDIGRTFTETPAASGPSDFLAHVHGGRAQARGDQGSAAKWAHAAMALAVRALGRGSGGAPDARAVLTMVERVVREGGQRAGMAGSDLGPTEARALLRAWLATVGLEHLDDVALLAHLQSDDFDHTELWRRARGAHERQLGDAVSRVVKAAASGEGWATPARDLFAACIPVVPYAPAMAFLGQEKGRLVNRDSQVPRVALIADGTGSMHGVTHTLDQIRQRGVAGYEVEVIGTDPRVDRRLPAVAEIEVPFYAGLTVGVPSLPAVVEVLAEGRYDLLHVCSPGPAGVAAALMARVMDLPVVGSHHTELGAYAALRSGDPVLAGTVSMVLGAFYAQCLRVLSPSPAADDTLRLLGVPAERIGRWDRGVDTERFDPRHRVEDLHPGEVSVLYAGRISHEKGMDLLVEAFGEARRRDPRLHLVLAGGGPEESLVRERLGENVTFLGWLAGDDLARAYASADAFVFPSATDTFGQVILEAQASGLAVVAVGEGGPRSLICHGVTGLLSAPTAPALADGLLELIDTPRRRERMVAAALAAVAQRTWGRALDRLAQGYGAALTDERRQRQAA